MRPDTSYEIGITRPEVVSSWRVLSDHLAPTREYRIPSGGKMARRCRITSTFITLMGEHISQVTMDWTGFPGDGCMAESRFACVYIRTRASCIVYIHIVALILSQRVEHLPSKPRKGMHWRTTVRFARNTITGINPFSRWLPTIMFLFQF